MSEIADLEWIVTDTELEALILEERADQAPPAALQRPAQRRQDLPLHQDALERRFPEGGDRPPHGAGWGALLRAVHVGRRRAPDAGRAAPRLPLPGLHREITGHDPQAVPVLPHQALRRAVHRRGDREGYRQIIDGLGAFLEGDSEEVLAQSDRADAGAAENLHFERAARLRDQIRARQPDRRAPEDRQRRRRRTRT